MAKGSKTDTSSDNAKSRIEKALSKNLGASAVKSLVGASANIKHWFTTGIPALDVVLSGQVGKGFPSGRICELYGDEHVGKTTLGMSVLRHAQLSGYSTCLIDTESRFTQARARSIGIDPAKLIVVDEQYLEPILDALLEIVLAARDAPTVIFWDTVASSTPLREKGCKVGEFMPGSHARPLSMAFRKMAKPLSESNVLILACNQMKEGAIGKMFATERDKEGTIGGKALRFHSDVRIKLCQHKKRTEGRRSTGFFVTARVTKNTNAVSDSYSRLTFTFEEGGHWDVARSTISTLQYWNLLEKKANSIVWEGKRMRESNWVKAYEGDKEFRASADKILLRAYQDTFLEEEQDD